MVCYRVAKTGKSHTIVENLILPAAADIAGIMLGEKAKQTIQKMPSSDNTVSRRIADMAEDVLKQLLLCIKSSEFYPLQIDESTDVAGLAQLRAYVRYIYDGSVMEDILFCKPLEGRATGEEIFKVLDGFVTSHGLQWTNCVGICTDGAKAMTGRLSGLVTRVQAVAPCAVWVHCSIHREALATKGMPERLKEVLQDAVKIVNFIKARPLNSRLFSALCNEMGSDHVTLLLHTDVRWLSRGKVLTRLFELKDELKAFFIDHPFELSNRLHDEEWLTILAYLGDVFSRLNELNIGLQGFATTIFNVQDKTEAMIRKFALWTNCINENNTEAFSSLHDFLLANELSLTNSVKRDIMKHLSELSSQLRKYFPETDNSNTWIRNPFSANSTAHLPVSERESLIEISTSGALRIDFAQKLLTDFWIALHAEYPALADRALKTLLPFSTTYLCESGFSALAHRKNKYRHRLCIENDLRLRLSPIQPNITELCKSFQAHPSH
ncbi:putative zinc finger BED domain-containing protein 5-like [Triplophysa rosa]|uniref:Zinc finger BED domain-containing protein 5-like n=1 Tax=Triplophysa rosa TaxID=992332 RepID=A0A9W7T4E6_TRIRA|nr:putative zinc finger BED domain-containing protein 5-like [Triplophysa rosa]